MPTPQEQDAKNDSRRTSDLLRDITQLPHESSVSIGDLVSLLGDRSFALVILLFALPNALPFPGIPGFSTLTCIPIILMAMQIAIGRESIWLPKRIAEKKIPYAFFAKTLNKTIPAFAWIEKWLHPRWTWLCQGISERLIGVLILVLAGILALPIPGGNFLPGLSTLVLALALLEKDGILAFLGVIFATGSTLFMYQVIVFVITQLAGWMLMLLHSGVFS